MASPLRFASLRNSSPKERAKLQAALFYARENRKSRLFSFPPPLINSNQGVFPTSQATFVDRTHFASSTGAVTVTAEGYQMVGAGCIVTFNLPSALTGEFWVELVWKETEPGGSFRPGFLSPTNTFPTLRNRGMDQIFPFAAVAGSTQIRVLNSGAGFNGTLIGLQLYNVAGLSAMPADVVIGIGQSNLAATTTGFPFVMALDGLKSLRTMYFPTSTNAGHGTTIGTIEAMRAPLQHQAMTGAALTPGMISMGVSPAVAFCNRLLPRIAVNRRLVYIACAISGAGFGAADAPWNPVGSNPVATNNFKTIVTQAMAALPAGSTVRLMIDASGEAETSANMSAVPAQYATSRNDLRLWLVAQGFAVTAPPIMALGGAPDASRLNQAEMILTYQRMDAVSGHASSLPYVHFVGRTALGMEDSTHPNAASNRFVGLAAGELAIARGLI